MRKIIRAFLILSFIATASCRDNIIDDGLVGPCVHEYKEAIIHISALTDSASGGLINFAKLETLKINGRIQTGSFLGKSNYGIVYTDSAYYCNFPCGFGNERGAYEFKIVAEGYKDKIVRIENVDYSIYKGGCPSFNDCGKRVTLTLTKK